MALNIVEGWNLSDMNHNSPEYLHRLIEAMGIGLNQVRKYVADPREIIPIDELLSKQRADAIMSHLRQRFNDPDLDREVGLLWLGEEYAQLSQDFCTWSRSGDINVCRPDDINRSAFVAWIDCHL